MSKQASYLIIGNGIAGVTAAETLRAADKSSTITIVAHDPFPVYFRPALKDYLADRLPEEKLWARPTTFYQEQRIRFIIGRVGAINAVQHYVQLEDGQQIGYDKLLLANGARPKRLSCPGQELAGVTTLRSITDYRALLRQVSGVSRVVVYGGGTLALESAETLRQRGLQVTHLLRKEILWSEVLDATASDLILREERRAGIDVQTGQEIVQIVGKKGRINAVITSTNARIPCDLLLVAIGVEPNIDFVQACGIACGSGIKVDGAMQTNMPDIYAAGDVVQVTEPLTGRTRLLGQWYPAIQQARLAASSMLGCAPDATQSTLYHATSLATLDCVALGLTVPPPQLQVQECIAEPKARKYQKIVLQNGVPVGGLFVGTRQGALALKRAMDHRVNLASVFDRLLQDDFELERWLDKQRVPEAYFSEEREDRRAESRSLVSLLSLAQVTSPSLVAFPGVQKSPLDRNQSTNASYLLPALSRLKNAPALVIVTQDKEPRIVPLEVGKRITLGRDPENGIQLQDSAASRRHAEILTTADSFYIRDLESRNGVFVNTVKVAYPYRLSHKDRIVLGNTLLYFSYPQPVGEEERSEARLNSEQVNPLPVMQKPSNLVTGRPPLEGVEHRKDITLLSKQRVRFEIDMCIGCDRCMAACPVPISSQVAIADLNQATVSPQVAEHVKRFTQECIMCGSCVPVCPVDNHRDLLMLSLKQRLGVSWDSQVEMGRIIDALPMGWSIPLYVSRLREQPILSDPQYVPENYLYHIIASSKLLTLTPDTTLLREGEYGRDLYLILEGRLVVLAAEASGEQMPLAILKRGEYVGDYGLLTGQPATTTVRTRTAAFVLQVPEQVVQRLMELVPKARRYFEEFNNARSIESILRRMALFQGVSEADIRTLVEQTQVKQYNRNERLFAENDQGGGTSRPERETMHMLLEGFVKVARQTLEGTGRQKSNERILAYRQSGDYFAGGLDLLGDGGAVTVTAITRTRVAVLPGPAVKALFQRYPEVKQRFSLRLREYLESRLSVEDREVDARLLQQIGTKPRPADATHRANLDALVKDGVVEGTEVLIIDLDKCIHCNECEEACARRHGHSRMNRKGMVVGNISIATACRQCQDPVCLLCSRAGIARRPNGEVYITDSCIGCGICAERCPYGAISIVNVEEDELARPTQQRFAAAFATSKGKERKRKALPMLSRSTLAAGPLEATEPQDLASEMRKKLAIKCDLCIGYADQACVEACPSGAALRVQPTKFFGSTEEILRRREK